jgi:predicted Rossmann fold flavoprotein
LRVSLLDTARKPGAKILVSGGSRCNVTNAVVSEADFWGGRRTIVRQILRALPVSETVAFFRELGVPLHEEADGKLFPDSNRARDVLEALLRESSDRGVRLLTDHRVRDVTRAAEGFTVSTSHGDLRALAVVLATGGRSLPKSGSDGAGYAIAERLGHTVVPTTPGLAPLLLSNEGSSSRTFHAEVSGVAHEVELTVWVDGARATRLSGPLLWTHFGISGPVAMNASRHWARADFEGKRVAITANFCPGRRFEDLDAHLTALVKERPRVSNHTALATLVPASVAAGLLRRLAIDGDRVLGRLSRDDRRRLAHALVGWKMPVAGTRGYNYAEVTAGGLALTEIDPATMESRVCPGLYLVGEILDVDGRIGGFNFQWAWATARVAAGGLAAAFRDAC